MSSHFRFANVQKKSENSNAGQTKRFYGFACPALMGLSNVNSVNQSG